MSTKTLKLYLLSQDQYDGFDTYDSVVVCAVDEEAARNISPPGHEFGEDIRDGSWADNPDIVSAKYIGKAATGMLQGVVLASFNAG